MMRILLMAAALFLIIHFIRVDFVEGTIPQNLSPQAEEQCEKGNQFITITSIHGDTIASLFALYPDHELSFIDRLEQFYHLNPSLKHQEIVGETSILLPISTSSQGECL